MTNLLQKLNIITSYQNVLFIGGPTASGKTSLSIKLANQLVSSHQPTWIISADSRQIYIHMDISTAKPTKRTLKSKILPENIHLQPIIYQNIPHFLFDIKYPNQTYTLFDFKKQAEEIINLAHSRQIKVIVVGGTGLYIDAIIHNYSIQGQTTSPQIKLELEKEYKILLTQYSTEHAKQKMWEKLNKLSPKQATKHSQGDIYSILRSLEVILLTDQPKSNLTCKNLPNFQYQILILDPPRNQLYNQINQRCQIMLDKGLIQETQTLIDKYNSTLPAMTSIGYKQFSKYLQSQISKQEALTDFQKATRNYAKRQLTWFRRYKQNPHAKFIDSYQILLKTTNKNLNHTKEF